MLFLRIGIGTFLFIGAFEVISNPESMAACADAWRKLGMAAPQTIAFGSVTAQLTCGFLLLFGLLTRMSGSLQAVNGMMVTGVSGPPSDWVSVCLSIIILSLCFYFAAHGGGRLSLDSRTQSLPLGRTALPATDLASPAEEMAQPSAPVARRPPGLY